MGARERLLGRDVVAVRRQPAQVGGALLDEVEPPVREVRRDLDADVRQQPPRVAHQRPHVVQSHLGGPGRHRSLVGERRAVAGPTLLGRLVGDVGHFRPVVPRVRNEVLEDQLLDVAVLGLDLGERLEGGGPVVAGLTDADEDPAGERDPQLPGRADRVEARLRMLGRRALVDDEVGVRRLEHQALRCGHLAQASELLAREHAEVRVGQQAALERSLAGPDDVGDEVAVPVRAQALGDHRVDLRRLAREHEQLLGVAPHRLFEALLDLVGRVEVRPVGCEGAVLAVAATGARERERVVAREGDPSHALNLATGMSWGANAGAPAPTPGSRRRSRGLPVALADFGVLDRLADAARVGGRRFRALGELRPRDHEPVDQ